VDELQAGMQRALAVLPQSPALFQPSKAALHYPALGHDLEGVQFTTLGYLHRHMLAQNIFDTLLKVMPGVCRIDPQHGDRLDIPASHIKTLRTRSLPIIAPMLPWLKAFPLTITEDGIKSAFRRARIKAGFPSVRFHNLRHACASLLIEAGEGLCAVGGVLGHTQVQTTRRYAHLQMQRKRTALDKIGSAISAQITPAKKNAPKFVAMER
jgi:hypothetical protein